jgi:hypothetical protein
MGLEASLLKKNGLSLARLARDIRRIKQSICHLDPLRNNSKSIQ